VPPPFTAPRFVRGRARWRPAWACAVSLCVAVSLGLSGVARADPANDLEKAHNAYVAHKYEDAENRLRALLDGKNGPLTDPDNVADARMYLGAVLLAEGKKDEASRVFEQLLLEKPDYEPDPLRVSLAAIDLLLDARARLRDKLAALQRAKVEAERQKAAARLALLEKLAGEETVVELHSRWIALVPFGAGQFQNGQDVLGGAFLGLELALGLGSGIGAGLTLYDASQARAALQRNDPTASAYQSRAQVAALVGDSFVGAFLLSAAIGILHAELTFVPQRTELRKRDVPPVSFAPFVGPGGVGLCGAF
jgi:hypothetical protein